MKTAAERREEKFEKTKKRVDTLARLIKNVENVDFEKIILNEGLFNFLRPNMAMINHLELPNYVGNIYKAICKEFGGVLVVDRLKFLYLIRNLPSFGKDIDSLHVENEEAYRKQRFEILSVRKWVESK